MFDVIKKIKEAIIGKRTWIVTLRGTCTSNRFNPPITDGEPQMPRICSWQFEKCRETAEERAWISNGDRRQPLDIEHVRTMLAAGRAVE